MLRQVHVVNPYAHLLTFTCAWTRTRRDHAKYLTLIRAVALLFQHQRERQQVEHDGETLDYIEVTPDDIAVANRLADTVLGRSLDELPPQTRRLLLLLDAMVAERCAADAALSRRADVRVTRAEIRAATGWGDTQLKVHLARLVDFEYVLAHRAPRVHGFVYELLWDGRGREGGPVLSGLLDPAELRSEQGEGGYDGQRSGFVGRRSGSGRPPVGVRSGPGRPALNGQNGNGHKEIRAHTLPLAADSTSPGSDHGTVVPVLGVAAEVAS